MTILPLLLLPADPFGLKTPWAAAFVPVAADTTVVRNVGELRASMARGGHVRLAAGRYDLGAAEFAVWKPTVLEGAGKGATVIRVGTQYATAGAKVPPDDYGVKVLSDTVGFKNLTICNASPTSAPNGILRGIGNGVPNQRIFFDGVRIEEGNGLAVYFDGLEDALMRNCDVTATSIVKEPLRITGTRRFRMEGNRFLWRAGRVVVVFAEDSEIVGNTFTFDTAHRSPGESGWLELSFASNVRFWDNRLASTGHSTFTQNDQEGIGTQMSILAEYQGDGKVVWAKGRSLATTLRWAGDPWLMPGLPTTRRKAVFLLSGKGAGQWRWATPGSVDGTMTIDRPWAPAPANGDRLSLDTVTAYGLDIRRNRIDGTKVGIELFDGGLNCAVVDNVVTNGGGILLRSATLASGRSPHSTLDNFPLWNVVAKGNRVVNADGKRPGALDVYSTDIGNTNLPMPFHNVLVKDNTIVGRNQTFGGEDLWQDGLLVGWNGTQGRVVPARRGGVTTMGNVLKGAATFMGNRPPGND